MNDGETLYRIHTKGNGTLTAVGISNSVSDITPTRGERARYTFRMSTDDLLVRSGQTHTVASGTEEVYATVTVEDGGTLTIEDGGTLTTTEGQFGELREYADHAGAFAPVETLNNTQRYGEQIPSDADVDSIVLGIEPSQPQQDRSIDGVWGIVTRATDDRVSPLTNRVISLEVQVLAEYSDYADHTAIENDLLA